MAVKSRRYDQLRFALSAIIGAAGLTALATFFWPSPPAVPAGTAVEAGPGQVEHRFEVRDGALEAGSRLVRARAGDRVTLRVLSDQDDELHVHGYDLTRQLQAGQAGELSWMADRAGRFEVELHDSHQTLTTLEIMPR